MFSSVIDVLEIVLKDDTSEHVGTVGNLLHLLEPFDFAFKMHLMRNVLGITNELSKALQRKDQDIVNAMEMVRLSKERFQMMRDDGWYSLLSRVLHFVIKMKSPFRIWMICLLIESDHDVKLK